MRPLMVRSERTTSDTAMAAYMKNLDVVVRDELMMKKQVWQSWEHSAKVLQSPSVVSQLSETNLPKSSIYRILRLHKLQPYKCI